jgi:alpha-beta hydrolase superfamily lysophospholipase
MITAGKDKLVDNKAANHFYSKCGTSAANKKLKQYPWAFHELHKEESIRADYYENIYTNVVRMLQSKDTSGNWTGISDKNLQVGRTRK